MLEDRLFTFIQQVPAIPAQRALKRVAYRTLRKVVIPMQQIYDVNQKNFTALSCGYFDHFA